MVDTHHTYVQIVWYFVFWELAPTTECRLNADQISRRLIATFDWSEPTRPPAPLLKLVSTIQKLYWSIHIICEAILILVVFLHKYCLIIWGFNKSHRTAECKKMPHVILPNVANLLLYYGEVMMHWQQESWLNRGISMYSWNQSIWFLWKGARWLLDRLSCWDDYTMLWKQCDAQ